MKKICTGCELPKDSEKDFSWKIESENIREAECRACRSVRQKIRNVQLRYDANVKIYKYLLEHPCVDCGNDNPIVLDFDHIKGRKNGSISKMASKGYVWKTIEEEMNKCEVRCANCHRVKTAVKRKTFRAIVGDYANA